MRRTILCFSLLFIPYLAYGQAEVDFDEYFLDHTMRIDYYHIGDAKTEFITVDSISLQGIWAGSHNNLIDVFNNGRYAYKVYTADSGKLIYSKGFDCTFGEYKTTSSAQKGVRKTYHESALIPFPKAKVKFVLEIRNRDNTLRELFSQEIDPASVNIVREPLKKGVEVLDIQKTGHPHNRVDIAILGEGYTREERSKFKQDLERFFRIFFSQEPFKSHRDHFNINGVLMLSDESGCDEPRQGLFRSTALDASFNSFGLERYLLTEDNKSLRDIAAYVPYDALIIMVNHERYGGGGIYNQYCVFTVDNQWHAYLLLHEFGHSFAGLADEYYTSTVAYNDFYPKGVEPVEPNITALLEPENLKWKAFITPGAEIPTPWEKDDYDNMNREFQEVRRRLNQKISQLKKSGAARDEIGELEKRSELLSKEHAEKMDAFLSQSRFEGVVGAFEGAGYSSQGLYRPMLDCIMFSKGNKPFCKVCMQAIIRMIKHYSR